MSYVEVKLREWEELLPEKDSPLFQRFVDDPASKILVEELNGRGIINVSELRSGLKIVTNSHVGSVLIGDIQLSVAPKIEGMPLYRLLKYAYNLRDLKLFDRATHDLEKSSFQDVLIHHLCAEAEEILSRGLTKSYVRLSGDLAFPKGRIDLNRFMAQAAISVGTLPCTYFTRLEDNELNRVLLAGLGMAIALTSDRGLKSKLHGLSMTLQESICRVELNRTLLMRVDKGINRLEEHYRPVLRLIRILFECQGISFDSKKPSPPLNGFFFDMNSFFQALLFKLLKEHLSDFRVRDEYTLHESFAYAPGLNPRGRSAPRPRPDFALMKGNQVIMLLDAKYRDLWEKSLPSSWLYQMTVYAASRVGNGSARILYPSMNENARLQAIDVRNPATGGRFAQIVLQPVHLVRIAELLDQGRRTHELRKYVNQLVFQAP